MTSPEPSEATEKRQAQEIADLKAAHAKEIALLHERHAEERAQRERTLLWLVFCATIWGLGLGLCEFIIEKLYFR
jgi:hypothetical protein